MVKAFKFGLIMPNMMVIGKKTKRMVTASSGTPMEIFMKVSGRMIKLMGMESMFMQMVHNMMATGRMIFKMVKAPRVGKMAPDTKVGIRKA